LSGRTELGLGRLDEVPRRRPDLIEVTDKSMSGEHAQLRHTGDGWEVRDLGSRNGTRVWGQPRSRALLADGDVIETGSTFWVFRSMLVGEGEVPKGALAPGALGSLYPPFARVLSSLSRIAQGRVEVMLIGATGTGKEVLARALHGLSGRDGPFVAINTAAIQPNLVASELFGVERGAHSMADQARIGRIRAAQGGTLLLDEIGDMPLDVQATLLRVIQESQVTPVGGDHPVEIDVRFVAATHHDLAAMVEAGSFRRDLYARLKGVVLELPALEDRIEDLGHLVATFLSKYGGADLILQPAAYRALATYDWPLNVRELEKAIEAAITVASGGRIELEHLPADIRSHKVELGGEDRVPAGEDGREKELERLLSLHRGNVSAVARSMGYSRMQVHRWLKQLAIDPATYR
jgi:DNA-binding NtrC family response regulator